jgi:hypothetical protein
MSWFYATSPPVGFIGASTPQQQAHTRLLPHTGQLWEHTSPGLQLDVITNRATTIPTSRQRLIPIDRRFKLHGKLPRIDYANSMRYRRPPNAARTAHFTVHPEGTHPASHSIAFLSLDHRAQGNGRHSTPAALSYLAAHTSPL